ncbi:antibiotic biosynthesis monooxygenase [Tepidicaulis marinus]|uniref:Antibiotic biosynthesis monooxygenase n=1 Tax=Tepidicaulis marinus TaxID=1333998 RepID=A0A081BAZ3_9HYPH|nr:antibiotic biosynthesis monooxygenase family protein [Tepidicaulis marinus]GAK45211.1 antibiotic biosynthesis monooxygenase [Tepidicaulis marinus]
MGVIGVVATMKVQAGKEAEFEKVFKDLQSKVKANEPGCLQYDLCKSKSNPQTFVIMEQYESQEALDAHGKSDYFKAAFPALGAVLDGAPGLEFLDRID